MPVRSLNSSVIVWPDRERVVQALIAWAKDAAVQQPEVLGVGYFGSYARGDWGVGSDLDVILIVEETEVSFERRSVRYDLTELPVAADVLVYTLQEWQKLAQEVGFGSRVAREACWVFRRE